MNINRISTGAEPIDNLIQGYETDVITTIYGPAGSGKTNLCIASAIETIKKGKKVIYIDTEGGFSIDRLKQLSPDFKKIVENIFFLRPTKFSEQKKAFERLKDHIKDTVGLIIIDSIAMLYRLEIGKTEDIYSVNRELGLQISYLAEIARKNKIPVLITNQVYSDFDNKDSVKMVGGDLLKYQSKCLLEVQKYKTIRKAILRKHRSLPENKSVLFSIEADKIKIAD